MGNGVVGRLEPELAKMAEQWDLTKRREMAEVFARWSRQLEISNLIFEQELREMQLEAVLLPLPARVLKEN